MQDADLTELDALILPEALLKLIASEGEGRAELHLVGNNAGIVSLANVLRWLAAHPRDALHLPDLPFVWSVAMTSLDIVRSAEPREGRFGHLRRVSEGPAFEWLLSDSELPRLADSLNLLAALGGRNGATYDTPPSAKDAWDAVVYLRVDETLDGG
jgi:hypothetical protein